MDKQNKPNGIIRYIGTKGKGSFYEGGMTSNFKKHGFGVFYNG